VHQFRIRTNHPVAPLIIGLLVAGLIAACASPRLQESSGGSGRARLGAEVAVMADGYRLPVRHWGDAKRARALVLALHGFNDYSNAFAGLGPFLAARGILTYAYDQRGFGVTAQRGRWGGEERMIADLQVLTALLRERHPGIPLFLLGESMGGAVIMACAKACAGVDGIVLVAPAVWSRDTMSPIQNLVLEAAAHTVPWLVLTGSGIEIRPSDNLEMLRAFNADPLVIKSTRVDALWGITNLMDLAMAKAAELPGPVLLLYGEHDEIIPQNAFCTLLGRFPQGRRDIRVGLYRNGWHMLTRDLQGRHVMGDIAAWLKDRNALLPSAEEARVGSERLERFCGS